MPLTLDQIAEEAMQLPPASRALLADKLVESLESEDLDEIRSGKVNAIPGEQVIEEVRRLVGR